VDTVDIPKNYEFIAYYPVLEIKDLITVGFSRIVPGLFQGQYAAIPGLNKNAVMKGFSGRQKNIFS
jgi:hypothetical protein